MPPPAIWASYGIRTTRFARVAKCASSSFSRTSGVPGVDWLSTTIASRACSAYPFVSSQVSVSEASRASSTLSPRDDDDLIGEIESGRHDGVHDSGSGVGEHQRVVVRRDIGDVAVVTVAERLGDARVGVGGEHVEPGRVAGDDRGEVVVPLDVVMDADEIAHRLAVVRSHDAVGQGSAVGVRIDRDDAILASIRQRHAEQCGDRRLADPALARQHRHEPGAAHERGRDPRRERLALARAASVADVDPPAGQRVEQVTPGPLGLGLGDLMRVEEAIGGEQIGALAGCVAEVVQALRGQCDLGACGGARWLRGDRLVVRCVHGRGLLLGGQRSHESRGRIGCRPVGTRLCEELRGSSGLGCDGCGGTGCGCGVLFDHRSRHGFGTGEDQFRGAGLLVGWLLDGGFLDGLHIEHGFLDDGLVGGDFLLDDGLLDHRIRLPRIRDRRRILGCRIGLSGDLDDDVGSVDAADRACVLERRLVDADLVDADLVDDEVGDDLALDDTVVGEIVVVVLGQGDVHLSGAAEDADAGRVQGRGGVEHPERIILGRVVDVLRGHDVTPSLCGPRVRTRCAASPGQD